MYYNLVLTILPSRIHVHIFKPPVCINKTKTNQQQKNQNEQTKIKPSAISQIHTFNFRSLQSGMNLTDGHESKDDLITFCVFDLI